MYQIQCIEVMRFSDLPCTEHEAFQIAATEPLESHPGQLSRSLDAERKEESDQAESGAA